MKLRSVAVVVALFVVGLPLFVAASPFLAPGAFGAIGPGAASLGWSGAAGTIVVPPEEVAAVAWRVGFRNWALVEAVAIAGAESHLTADALGDTYPIRGLLCPSHGLWQIRSCPGTPGGLDRGPRATLLDPAVNAAAAYRLFLSPRGWHHWSVYTSGTYLEWLPQAIAATSPYRAGVPQAPQPAPMPTPSAGGVAGPTPPLASPTDPRR